MARQHPGAAALAALVLAMLPGCGGASPEDYSPDTATARDSLDAALAAWQKGGKAAELAAGTPAVYFVDFQWDNGKALESYQIVEETPAVVESEKRYKVVLKLKDPAKEEQAEYIAVGKAPLWIFRDEDYKKQLAMGEETPAGISRPAGPNQSGRRP